VVPVITNADSTSAARAIREPAPNARAEPSVRISVGEPWACRVAVPKTVTNGEPEGAAEPLEGLEESGGGSRLTRFDARENGGVQRHEAQAHAQPHHQQRAEQAGEVAVAGLQPRQPAARDGDQGHSGEQHGLGAEPPEQPWHEAHGREHQQGHREEGETGAQRAVSQGLLADQGEEVEHAEHARGQQQDTGVAPRPVAAREEAQRHDGLLRARLHQDEAGEQGGGRAEGRHRPGVAPALLRDPDERVDQ